MFGWQTIALYIEIENICESNQIPNDKKGVSHMPGPVKPRKKKKIVIIPEEDKPKKKKKKAKK